MGVCPKCGANNTGQYLIGGLIALVLCVYAFMPDKKPTETIKSATVEQTADADMQYYVDTDYKVIRSFPVCVTLELYKEFIESDYKNKQYLYKQGSCILLKQGVKISVIDRPNVTIRGIRIFASGGEDTITAYTGVEYVVPERKNQ